MPFEITGQVCVKETGKPFPGLIVRVQDQDLGFDHDLGTTLTDQNGRFRFVYTEKDFPEAFEQRPEVFVSVYAPPLKHLVDTKQRVRWGASARAEFAVVVGGEEAGQPARASQENQVQGGVSLSTRQLRIDVEDGFHVPRLPGFGNGTRYGAPSILEQLQYVVIPAGATVKNVEIDPGPVVRTGRKIKPLPVQRPLIDVPDEVSEGGESDHSRPGGETRVPEFMAPDPRYYQSGRPYPEKLVILGRSEDWEGVQRIHVRVRPLQYDPASQQYLFYPKVSYTIHFDPAPAQAPARRFTSQLFTDSLRRTNVHAYSRAFVDRFQKETDLLAPHRYLKVPYLIITDDFEWQATGSDGNAPPTGPGKAIKGGGIVSQFRRLAKWKAQRGIRTNVVTVSEIIANANHAYGDLLHRRNVSAEDLQEVIRNFIWWAHESWGVEYLLLGGDTNIIPMRELIGYITSRGRPTGWDCMRTTSDDIKRDQCKFYPKQKITKIHYCGKAEIYKPLPLLTHQGGKEIKYGPLVPADHFPRWYFVPQYCFAHQTDFTSWEGHYEPPHYTDDEKHDFYVIVEDDGNHFADINDDYYWVSQGRRIPTDRYYACAGSPTGIGQNARDFDENGNGFPGQFRWDEATENDVPIDGFKITPDVYIGRAPVRTANEARAFVDKVLSYEQLRKVGDAPAVNTGFLKRVVHAAALDRDPVRIKASGSGTTRPEPGTFMYDSSKRRARIQLESETVPNYDFRLISQSGAAETYAEIEIPYAPSARTGPRWRYMKDNFENNQPSGNQTRFIQVEDLSTSPTGFWLDRVGVDDFHKRANGLTARMLELYPEFKEVKKLYQDPFEPVLSGEPQPALLTDRALHQELSHGCHFVTLNGHGKTSGCCTLKASDTYTNESGSYIAYAHSCSTASPDSQSHSLGEALVVQKGGGAVAYVGSARMDGDHLDNRYAEQFWERLFEYRRLGAASADCDYTGGDFWHFYCRTLYGDPEMPVWVKVPRRYLVTWPMTAVRGAEIVVRVRELPDPTWSGGALGAPKALENHLVTLVAGWDPLGTDPERQKAPEWLVSRRTESDGEVRFKIPPTLKADQIEITVCACAYSEVSTKYDFIPETHTMTITS